MNQSERIYQLALTFVDGIGDVTAKNLIAYCGGSEAVFKEKKAALLKIPGIGSTLANSIFNSLQSKEAINKAEKELSFVMDNAIEILFFTEDRYPNRLKYCNDSPILLYYKGNADLNAEKVISIVGTRTPTRYGLKSTEQLVCELKDLGILVVSGMAYGIDIAAHKECVNNGIDTVGVMAHGLDRIYPEVHEATARKMLNQGALITEFPSKTNPDRENFPKRNRIVAGMCDAIIVMESKLKGGSLITAEIGNSYNKDVFAYPGRSGDECSVGCNAFIKRNKAVMIENASDLLYAMNWQVDNTKKNKPSQIPLLLSLTEFEQKIVTLLQKKESVHIDEICSCTEITMSQAAGVLLQLEFSNIVKSLPGKMYSIN